MATPDWDTSQTFLQDHPELLGQDVPGILAGLGDDLPSADIALHQALLTLATGPAGVGGTYRCVVDQQELGTLLAGALTVRDPSPLQAWAMVEGAIHGQAFAGAFHMALALLLADPSACLPSELSGPLTVLAAEADPAERDLARAQLSAVLTGTPGDSTTFSSCARRWADLMLSRSRWQRRGM
jgi:hypothetical protein